jgi:hypothetical protein
MDLYLWLESWRFGLSLNQTASSRLKIGTGINPGPLKTPPEAEEMKHQPIGKDDSEVMFLSSSQLTDAEHVTAARYHQARPANREKMPNHLCSVFGVGPLPI